MKAYEIAGAFGLGNIRCVERPVPKPGPGQVLIRLRAVSVNQRDLLVIEGSYNANQQLPLTPFSDGAGEVAEIGPGVGRIEVGDRVVTCFQQGWIAGDPSRSRLRKTLGSPLAGVLAEYAVVDEDGLVMIPDHLSYDQASTLPVAGVTAWNALNKYRRLRAGEVVLVQGTGGVSVFATQFAKLLGARVIITSKSDEKLNRARRLGADFLINYADSPHWEKQVRALTHGVGVDQIVEVGGANTFGQSLRAAKIGGFIAVIGVLGGATGEVNLNAVLMRSLTIQGITVGHRDDFEAMNRAITMARLEPVIDKVFPFDQAVAALEHLKAGAHFGKLVVSVG